MTASDHTPPDVTPEGEETDAGPGRKGAGAAGDPQRRCIATMERLPQSAMVRFALSPDGVATPDIQARLPGRGAWVTSNRSAVELAVKRGAFSRAFKAQARAPDAVADIVEQQLARRVLDMLGLARRAGDIILGFEQVREEIRFRRPACLIEASNGAEDGRHKLLLLLKAAHGEGDWSKAPPVAGCFTAEELGMAFGRDRVIHGCFRQGRFAHAWIVELSRLSGFRAIFPEDWRAGDGQS